MRLITIALAVLALLSGCSKNSTYIECKAAEESKGVSVFTAVEYCLELVKKGEIECGDHWACQNVVAPIEN